MPIDRLEHIAGEFPQNVPLLGLDVGRKTIGVAVSDSAQSLATPLQTIKRAKFAADMAALTLIIKEYGAGALVLGYPVNMDGSEGPSCDFARSFADEMMKRPEIAGKISCAALWDERLSTVSVKEMVDNAVDINKGKKRGAKENGLIDKLAAQVILQGALDYLRRSRHTA